MDDAAELWDRLLARASRTARSPSASASTAPPAASRRATGPTATSSTPSGPSSRPACSDPRSRPPTSSARRPTWRSARRRPQTVLCTLTVEDHTSASGVKRYMLGGEPIVGRDGGVADRRPRPPPLRHHRRLGALARQARAAGVPADRAGRDRHRARRVLHGGALPRDRAAPWTPRRCSTRATSGCAEGTDRWSTCWSASSGSRTAPRRSSSPRTARRVDGRRSGFTMSAHEECAVELAVQSVGDGQATVLTLGDAEAVEQLRTALAVGCTAATHVRRRPAAVRPDRRRPRDRRRWSVTTRPPGGPTT